MLFLVSCTGEQEKPSTKGYSELWIMVNIDSKFRSKDNLKMVDEITEIIESKGLGNLDGHSSGGYQFDFNYVGIQNWDSTKSEIETVIKNHYPGLEYTISTTYETTYEKL